MTELLRRRGGCVGPARRRRCPAWVPPAHTFEHFQARQVTLPAVFRSRRRQVRPVPGPVPGQLDAGPDSCRAGSMPGFESRQAECRQTRIAPCSAGPERGPKRPGPPHRSPAEGDASPTHAAAGPLGRSEATCKETFLLRRHAEERRGKMAAKAIEVTAESPRPLQRTAERLPLVGGGGASPSVGAERLPLSSVSLSSVSLSSTRTAPVVVRVEHPAAPAPRPRRRRALHQEPTSTLDRPTGPRNGRGTGV